MKRRLVRVLGLLLVLLCGAGVGLYLLSGREPAWWYRPDARTPLAAERLENQVVSELSLARPAERLGPYRSGEWTLEVTEEEANAWLATRLRAWVENRAGRWPGEVEGVRAAFRPGMVLLGARLDESYGGRVVSGAAVPRIEPGGALWLRTEGMSLGGLPLPSGVLLDRLRSMVHAGGAEVVAALDGQAPLLPDAVVPMDDGRRVRITRIEVREGVLVLTCRTEKD